MELVCGLAVTTTLLLVLADPSRPSTRLRRLGPDVLPRATRRPWPPGHRWWFAAAVAGAAVAWSAPGRWPWLLVALLTPTVAARTARGLRRRRETRRRAAAVVDVVFALAAELRAGRPPADALRAVSVSAGPLADPLAGVARSARAGGSASAELRRLSAVPGCSALAGVAAAWSVTERVGGPVADVLDRVGRALDDDEQHRRSLEALLAGPRTTMLLLAALPLVGIALAHSLGAHPLQLLMHDRVGWALAAGAAVLDGVGVAWTRALARAAARP